MCESPVRVPCDVEPLVAVGGPSHVRPHLAPPTQSRRDFVRRGAATLAGLTCADFLAYFAAHGMPGEQSANNLARDATRASEDPHFLVYWFLEGGWCWARCCQAFYLP